MSGDVVVILRPSEDSAALAQAAADLGFTPWVEPVLAIEYPDGDMPVPPGGAPLIFTSANGVTAFCRHSPERDRRVYAVGANTAAAASAAGFENVVTGAGTVEGLADLLVQDSAAMAQTPLYVRGADVSKDLKAMLAGRGVPIHEHIGYRSVAAETLSLTLLKALDGRQVAAVMLFSAKGGAVFSGLIEQYGRTHRLPPIKALCIGDAVLQSVSVLPFGGTAVADTPDRYGMIKLLEQLKDQRE